MNADGAFNAHMGRRQAIIHNLLGSKPGVYYLDQIYGQVRQYLEQGLSLCLVLACASNRHRSVAFGTMLRAAFWPAPVMLVHLDAKRGGNWNYMRCGGNCRECGPTGYTPSTVQALQNQAKRHLSAEARKPKGSVLCQRHQGQTLVFTHDLRAWGTQFGQAHSHVHQLQVLAARRSQKARRLCVPCTYSCVVAPCASGTAVKPDYS